MAQHQHRLSVTTRRARALAIAAAVGITAAAVPAIGEAANKAVPAKPASAKLRARFEILNGSHKHDRRVAHVSVSSPSIAPAITALTNAGAPTLFGLNMADAEQVAQGTSDSIWLIPGSDGLCAIISYSGAGRNEYGTDCTHTAQTVSNGDVAFADFEGKYFAWGVVPNGTTEATVSLPGGGTSTLPVTDNTFAGSFGIAPTQVAFSSSSGTASLPAAQAGEVHSS